MRLTILMLSLLLFFGCKATKMGGKPAGMLDYGSPSVKQKLVNDQMFLIEDFATDETYGYTEENPIMVGKEGGGPKDERRFLNALAGPEGEKVIYQRLGSCCQFYTKNGLFENRGLLDRYEVTYVGLDEPVILYINMYDSDKLQVPVGFSLKE